MYNEIKLMPRIRVKIKIISAIFPGVSKKHLKLNNKHFYGFNRRATIEVHHFAECEKAVFIRNSYKTIHRVGGFYLALINFAPAFEKFCIKFGQDYIFKLAKEFFCRDKGTNALIITHVFYLFYCI